VEVVVNKRNPTTSEAHKSVDALMGATVKRCLVCTQDLTDYGEERSFVYGFLVALTSTLLRNVPAEKLFKTFLDTLCEEHRDLVTEQLAAHDAAIATIRRSAS
jgi:hypothetical protein